MTIFKCTNYHTLLNGCSSGDLFILICRHKSDNVRRDFFFLALKIKLKVRYFIYLLIFFLILEDFIN